MKKLLGIVVLSLMLITPSQADDIRDFEIEGISIGDSLLDYVSKKEINNNLATYYKDNKYSSFQVYKNKGSFKIKQYDHMVITFKTSDSKFKIVGVSGIIWHQKTINQCYQDMKEVISDISEILINVSPTKIRTIDTHHGKNTYSRFNLTSGDVISVQCTDYDSKHKNFWDHLRITTDTDEFLIWIETEAYK